MAKTKKSDYTIGYGKPPEHRQFKPGQSGNPKGRPKGSKNTKAYILEEANSMVSLSNGETTTKMPKVQAIIKTATNKALRGDMRAIAWVVARILEAEDTQTGSLDLSEDDKAILERYLQRHKGGTT